MASTIKREAEDDPQLAATFGKLFSPPLLLLSDQQQQQFPVPNNIHHQIDHQQHHHCQAVPGAVADQTFALPAPFLPPAITTNNGIAPAPTMENFFHFVHLANTFGFQFDLGQKLLRWNPPTVATTAAAELTATAAQKQQQQEQEPMEEDEKMETTTPPSPIDQPDQQKRRPRRKVSNSSSNGHLTVPSTSRCPSSASTVKAHLPTATVSPIHSNGTAEHTPNVMASAQMRQFCPLLAQLAPAQPLNTAIVREYLANPSRYDCVLWIYHAKVAQKSYGTEKRFFCPPPCVYLLGEGWQIRRKLLDQLYRHHHHHHVNHQQSAGGFKSSPPNACGGEPAALFGSAEGRELFSGLSASIVVGAEGAEDKQYQQQKQQQQQQHTAPIHHLLDFSNGKDYSAAKALFISDSDKRKYFHLHAHFGYAGGALELGIFPSQRIKVISKPSKKKQSMKSSDCKYLCVGNKSKIALFNRLRSQTVSTRYLHVDAAVVDGSNQKTPIFVASSTKWDAFHINVVEPCVFNGQQQPHHSVTYGSVIQLVDSLTEMRLPLMRIRKVDKQNVLLDPAGQGEPVSQLHKCAFQMVDRSRSNGMELFYLCLSQEKIIQYQALQIDAHRHQISDGAAWTIISTDKAEFRWAEPFAASNGSLSRNPITPVPQLCSLNMLDASCQKLLVQQQVDSCRTATAAGSATIELNGSNFTSALRVWFGATPAETIFCTPERLSCAVPSLYTVCKDLGCTVAEAAAAYAANGGKLAVPLLLARDEDGVLFPTAHTFPYQLQTPPASSSESSSSEPNQRRSPETNEHSRRNSTFAKNDDELCTAERFYTDNAATNGIGELQLLMMDNAN